MLELLGIIFVSCVTLCWFSKPKAEARIIVRERIIENGVDIRREVILEMPDEWQNVLQSRNGSAGSRWRQSSHKKYRKKDKIVLDTLSGIRYSDSTRVMDVIAQLSLTGTTGKPGPRTPRR